MMKRKIVLMLVAFALCLGTAGCALRTDDADAQGASVENMTAEDLDFSYELLDSFHRYARAGGTLHIQGYVTNISENTYAFSGDTVPEVHLVLYCQKGEQRYVISHEPIAVPTAGAAASGFAPGEKLASYRYAYVIPDDAPLGAYCLEVSYRGCSQVFENVVEVIDYSPYAILETGEEKFDPDATVADIAFSYHLIDHETRVPVDKTTFRPDEAINILGYITNVSDKVLTYTEVRGMFVKLCLYCETDDGRYEMSYVDMKHNTVPPQEVEFVPGRTVVENRYCFYSEDHNAPVGTYHLEISVPGFQQTFYGVLTVVE